jgi:lipopolysaccharide transport system permease protein
LLDSVARLDVDGVVDMVEPSSASFPLTGHHRVLRLDEHPDGRRAWFAGLWAHREVLDVLARKDFQTRYKRATFGLAWAVAVPTLQAAVMAVVFSRVIALGTDRHFAVYVMSGVVAYSYFSVVTLSTTTAIVDGAGLTDKVWFPRVLLIIVPCLSNLVGFAVTLVVLVAVMPFFGLGLGLHVLFILPATALLVAFCLGLGMVLGALDVYFRDVKFLVQAALLVCIYLTPILYPQHVVGPIGPWLDLNPLTGIVVLFHMATIGSGGPWVRPVTVSVLITAALLVVGAEVQRRHDRLFVDQL